MKEYTVKKSGETLALFYVTKNIHILYSIKFERLQCLQLYSLVTIRGFSSESSLLNRLFITFSEGRVGKGMQ